MSEPKPKAQIMRELRTRRREAGLVKVEGYVTPENRERLARYIVNTLGGECNIRIKNDDEEKTST